MAIKIECSQCGYQNELGRMFCGGCGQKIDMNATSMQDLGDRVEFDYGKFVRRLVTTLVLLLVIVPVGLAFWTVKTPVVFSDAAGAVQVPIKARAIRQALSYNRAIVSDLSEGELNGFLSERARSRKLGTLAIDLKTGTFELYSSTVWCPLTNVSFLASVKLPVSLGLCGSFKNGVMTVEQARVGHLPIPGTAKGLVTGYFASLFKDILGEQRIISALRTVEIDDTKANLSFSP
ncbi:MAG: zinc ribbon domain-containing protein [bacterium]